MLGALQDECRGRLRTVLVWRALSGGTKSVPTRNGHSQPNWCDLTLDGLVNNPHACVRKSTLAQGTRVGGFEGGLVAKERLLVFGQLAGQHDSTKPLKKNETQISPKRVI